MDLIGYTTLARLKTFMLIWFFLGFLAQAVLANPTSANSALIQEIETKLEQKTVDQKVCEPLKAKKFFFFYYRCRAARFKEVTICKRFFASHREIRKNLRPNVQNCEAPGKGLIEYTN